LSSPSSQSPGPISRRRCKLRPPVLQRSAACCTRPRSPLQKPVAGATKEVPATYGRGLCYKRRRWLLHAVVASATSGSSTCTCGGGLCYKRRR
jgi:hypothetical protein